MLIVALNSTKEERSGVITRHGRTKKEEEKI
jgi:hypothetical protein